MNTVVKQLLDSFRQLLATPELAAQGDVDSPDPAAPDVGETAALFADLFGTSCPPSMQPGLLLPDLVSVTWQYNRDVSGEAQLSNLFRSMHRRLDASARARRVLPCGELQR